MFIEENLMNHSGGNWKRMEDEKKSSMDQKFIIPAGGLHEDISVDTMMKL